MLCLAREAPCRSGLVTSKLELTAVSARSTRIPHKPTLSDYLAVAFLNAVFAAPTGLLLWFGLNRIDIGLSQWLPLQSILWFTAAVVVLGLILGDAWLARFYGWVWRRITWLDYY